MAVDALDARILRLLLEQPRTSVREYARILGVARGTLQARLDRLERDGVITSPAPGSPPPRSATPCWPSCGSRSPRGISTRWATRSRPSPRSSRRFSITGGGDLITRGSRRDNAHLEDIIQRLIRMPGVVRTRTEIALRERVPHRVLPLVESVGRSAGPQSVRQERA